MLIKHLINALKNSLNGIKQTWKHERAFRIEAIGGVAVLGITWGMEATQFSKLCVVFALGLVFITELLNTAIEKMNDALQKAYDPHIKFSKDAGSAAVFMALSLLGICLLNLLFS